VRALAATGTDILLTTHYLEEADQLADHVAVIDHGRVIAAGPLGELKASIGQDVIDVAVSDPRLLPAVTQILERVTAGPARPQPAGQHVTALAPGGPAQLAAVIGGLQDAEIAVDEVGLRRPSLDEAFLTLTGAATGADHPSRPTTAGQQTTRSAV
jgi:ABC-2 type transport system ATP-binding protein